MTPAKRAVRKSAARKTGQRKALAQKASRQAATSMSAEHKEALAVGREESRAVRAYLEVLEAHKPKRGRKRTPEGIKARLKQIDKALPEADPLSRVHLTQEGLNLESELSARDESFDLSAFEAGFVKVAAGYASRKGLSYGAWREAGVSADVLRRAGIPRTRR